MIAGKTGVLVGASLELGALVGAAAPDTRQHLAEFGRHLGLAFQIQDDILGIWGDEALTGKSAESDILTRKKSLPVIYALQNPEIGPALARRYTQSMEIADIPEVLELLLRAGARQYAEQMAQQATDRVTRSASGQRCTFRGESGGPGAVRACQGPARPAAVKTGPFLDLTGPFFRKRSSLALTSDWTFRRRKVQSRSI